ncbi:MAG: thioesterase [Armatimonadota bacterium]|nr:thioesterase [Armatimonadota bacterium]
MRAGLAAGDEAEVTVTVTDEMLARFDDLGLVHPVYSTWSMVKHMELASRHVILPYLEPEEEAVGHAVSVTHHSPTPSGARVTVRARLVTVQGNQVICAVAAHNDRGLIGEGTTIQIVLPKDVLRARFAAAGIAAFRP